MSPGRAASVSDAAERAAFVLILLCVAVAPFPWGAILPGGNAMIEAFAFLAATLAFLATRSGPRIGLAAIPAAGMVAIALVGVVQLIPITPALLRYVSPASAKIYDDANAVLRLFGHHPVASRISIAPSETRATILLTCAYLALFVASILVCNTRRRRRWLLTVLLVGSSAHAIIATFQVGTIDRVHGAFINANHLAGYLEISLSFAFGLIWAEVLLGSDRVRRISDAGARMENRALSFMWRILLWAIVAAGIALTRSRGGVLAAVLTTLMLLATALSRRKGEGAAVLTITAITLGVALVAFTTGEAAILRFLSSDPRDLTTEVRTTVWSSSLAAWRQFPNFGDGLGAFKEAFRRVQPKEIDLMVEQAHNDFLQLLVTGGWIGAARGLAVYGSLFVTVFRSWLHQHHREESAFALAAFGALLSLTLHGLVEFNMSVPAIPATLAIMVGAGVSAAQYRPIERLSSA